MPDILDTEKAEIREIARIYAQSMWKVPFDKGLLAYVKTNSALYVHPARWKFCLKCGEINKKEAMNKHNCTLYNYEDFPVIIQTSWYKLKDFFLSDTYKEIITEIGLDKLVIPQTIKTEKSLILEETKVETASEKKGN